MWRPSPHKGVIDFLSSVSSSDTYLSLFTVTELRYGINLLADGKRKLELENAYKATINAYQHRIISPNLKTAETYAILAAEQRKLGTPRPIFDLWLTATAQVNSLTLVTRNVPDFVSLNIKIENPFDSE